MLSLLPLVFLCLATRLVAHTRRESGLEFDLRDALLRGAVWTGLWGALGAEVLSAFRGFSTTPVQLWWAVPIPVLGVALWLGRSGARARLGFRPELSTFNLMLVGIALTVLLITGLMAFLTPPMTPDSLCYHLPRQVYWIQNHRVWQYPCWDLRQLEMPPLEEYLSAQLMLLSGTDHQANLVQWFSYALCALGASAIARDMGAGPHGQSFAALLALLNPAAATQAENPKNDLLVALWTIVLLWCAVRLWVSRELWWRRAILIGITLGLLLLTKGTAFVVAPPICIIIAIGALRAGPRRAVLMGSAMVCVALAINTPHWVRNYRCLGAPINLPAERGGYGLSNREVTPKILASNIIRNLSLHTSTPWPNVNAREREFVLWVHRRLGISVTDVRAISPYNAEYVLESTWSTDGNNPAPVHLLLAIAMMAGFRPRRFGGRAAWPVFLVPYASVLLFAVMLKWQAFHCRLHIPIVATAAPVLAVWLARRPVAIALSTSGALFLVLCALLYQDAKPILGPRSVVGMSRDEVVDSTLLSLVKPARDAADALNLLRPKTVGILIEPYALEYLALRQVVDRVESHPYLFMFRPLHDKADAVAEPPDAVLVYLTGPARPLIHEPSSTQYVCASQFGGYKVYVPSRRLREARLVLPISQFFGWESEEGLRQPDGPMPQFDLPVVRWANKRVTTLGFHSDGSPMALIFECRRNDSVDQAMTVKVDGDPILHFEFGDAWTFLPFRESFTVPPGDHKLTFEFANVFPGSNFAVLFRKLQVVPASWVGNELH